MSTSQSCFRRCCPDGCCGFCKPPPQIQKQIENTVVVKKDIQAKDVPYGFIHIYPGVRKANNEYTSPILGVHLYHKSEFKANIERNEQTLAVSNDQERVQHGPQKQKNLQKMSADEELIMIPVEDVIWVGSNSEVTTSLEADISSHIQDFYEDSENCCDRCAASISKFCCCKKPNKIASEVVNNTFILPTDTNRIQNYHEEDVPIPRENPSCCTSCINKCRCWCCRRRILTRRLKKVFTVAEREAQRVITVTLQYSKYSHLDTPSNTRLLSDENRAEYYKETFNPNTEIKFYLLNKNEYEKENFDQMKKQGAVLCHGIMQLKAMKNHYPSEIDLPKILDQPHERLIGIEFKETPIQLEGTSNRSIEPPQSRQKLQPTERQAIEANKTTTAELSRINEEHGGQRDENDDDGF